MIPEPQTLNDIGVASASRTGPRISGIYQMGMVVAMGLHCGRKAVNTLMFWFLPKETPTRSSSRVLLMNEDQVAEGVQKISTAA